MIGESGVVPPGAFFAESDRGVEAAGEVRGEQISDFLRWDGAAAAVLRFADEFDGVNQWQEFIAVVALEVCEAIETFEGIAGKHFGVVGVAACFFDLSGIDMHAGKGFEIWFDGEAVAAIDVRSDPAAADVELFGANFEAGPEGRCGRVFAGVFEHNFNGSLRACKWRECCGEAGHRGGVDAAVTGEAGEFVGGNCVLAEQHAGAGLWAWQPEFERVNGKFGGAGIADVNNKAIGCDGGFLKLSGRVCGEKCDGGKPHGGVG